MSAITELASRLGKTIASSPQATALRDARAALNAEPELTQVLKDFQAQSDRIRQLEAENKPVEVDDKHNLQALQDKLVGSEIFKKFTASQVDYIDLMRQVNQAIQNQLVPTEGS